MADHLARSARQRRVAILAIALASGGIAFTYASGDDGADNSPTGRSAPAATTDASVLGVVVTQPGALPTAAPAAPAPVDHTDDDDDDDDARSPTTTRRTSDTTDRSSVSLVPPTFIENTTSTTDGTPPPTIDLSTTTTSPATTTTEIPPG